MTTTWKKCCLAQLFVWSTGTTEIRVAFDGGTGTTEAWGTSMYGGLGLRPSLNLCFMFYFLWERGSHVGWTFREWCDEYLTCQVAHVQMTWSTWEECFGNGGNGPLCNSGLAVMEYVHGVASRSPLYDTEELLHDRTRLAWWNILIIGHCRDE